MSKSKSDSRPLAPYTAFGGQQKVAEGSLREVLGVMRPLVNDNKAAELRLFDNQSGKVIDVDFSGSLDEILERIEGVSLPKSVGRPKLGVVCKEVSLLPRHWEWLASQPGGASSTLRRLVEDARKYRSGAQLLRETQETTYRFMQSMAGDLPGYEDALRALYKLDAVRFGALTQAWPKDIREQVRRLAAPAL